MLCGSYLLMNQQVFPGISASRTSVAGVGWRATLLAILFVGIGAGLSASAFGQPFQIVWVVIGEASSAPDNGSAHAGRQLFMASDLVSKSLANVKVEQVDVTPAVSQMIVGQRLCLTSLGIRTLGPGRHLVAAAPLSVSVRQDHKLRLGLKRTKRDICVQPTASGEYPVRLTSMLPARDGTTRGAQIFLRVNDPVRDGVSTTVEDQ